MSATLSVRSVTRNLESGGSLILLLLYSRRLVVYRPSPGQALASNSARRRKRQTLLTRCFLFVFFQIGCVTCISPTDSKSHDTFRGQLNNSASNLIWCTFGTSVQYTFAISRTLQNLNKVRLNFSASDMKEAHGSAMCNFLSILFLTFVLCFCIRVCRVRESLFHTQISTYKLFMKNGVLSNALFVNPATRQLILSVDMQGVMLTAMVFAASLPLYEFSLCS